MRYFSYKKGHRLSIARCCDPVIAVVAMGSVIGREGYFVAASGVHG
jgi:prolipoprotein diacylglyceryltransferase